MKNKTGILHGNIAALAVRRLGGLEMRVVDAARPFNVTFLHEALPPRAAAPYVVHSRTMELVYVTKGRMTGLLDGRKIALEEGDYLFIPPGTEHRFSTAGSGVVAVSIFSPPLDPDSPDAKIVFKKKRTGRARK